MTPLLSLPVELQLEIVKAVSHKDLLNFSLTCKNLYQLAKDRMAEHKDWSKYGRNGRFYFRITNIPKYIMPPTTIHGFQVFIANSPPFPHVEERPLTLTHELLTFIYHNPQFSRHIESLEEDSLETESNFQNAGSAVTIDTELINRLLKSCKFIESGERDDWKRSIDIGQGGASPALLFAQLPNLKHLLMEIRLSDLIAPYISKIIMRCAAKAYMGYIDQPLSSLRSAKICWYSEDDEEGDDSRYISEVRDSYNKGCLILLQSLTLLPLFQELHIHSYRCADFDFVEHDTFREMNLLHLDNFHPNEGFFNKPSVLRSLKLTHVSIRPSFLFFLLRGSGNLEKLIISICQSPLYVLKLTSFIETIEILLTRSLSLKSLHIVADTNTLRHLANPRRPWNVEGFRSLTHLTINTNFLPVRATGVYEALIDVLPQSIQCVDIIYSGFVWIRGGFHRESLLSPLLTSFDP